MTPFMTYICLVGAVLTEVIATLALAASQSFSRPLPTIISVVCFVAAFWLLSFPLRTMPTGIVYAVWSGLAIVLVTAAAWIWSKQTLDSPAIIGMTLITAGVIIINLFSQSEMPTTSTEISADIRTGPAGTSKIYPHSQGTICSAAKSTECYQGAIPGPLAPSGASLSSDFLRHLARQQSNPEQRIIEETVFTATPDQRNVMRLDAAAALRKLNGRLAQRPLSYEEKKAAERAIELLICTEAVENGKDWQFRLLRRAQLTKAYLRRDIRDQSFKA